MNELQRILQPSMARFIDANQTLLAAKIERCKLWKYETLPSLPLIPYEPIRIIRKSPPARGDIVRCSEWAIHGTIVFIDREGGTLTVKYGTDIVEYEDYALDLFDGNYISRARYREWSI